jgi:His/Glu/Gln/Arg/opine family amino acid ABC transporter permease subunit
VDWTILSQYRWALAQGAITTAELSIFGIVGGTILGLIISAASQSPAVTARGLAAGYVEIIRNVPSIVKIFILFYVVGLDAFTAGALGLSIHQSAYIADVFNSGFRSIPQEQSESARVLGHTYPQVFTHVLLPQLLRPILPPLTSQYIEVIKNSPIVMFLALPELTYQTQQIEFETGRGYIAAIAVTVIYLVIALIVSTLMSVAGRSLRRAV